ncbi:AAA family ATPase [Enterobacter ludwigii]|jgi:AAA15 family ATPase/GTPase|uniref:hypothetical protein n=1 Tax=Enterobacter ludwigii TaxID=299767 RepID=UPI003974F5C0
MPFTNVKITNMYSFDETELNLSYTRKPLNSPLHGEFLPTRPNFHFKKICIISGANASGKTSFGRVMLGMQNFIDKKQFVGTYLDKFTDSSKNATVEVDYVNAHTLKHNRLLLEIKKDESGALVIVRLQYANVSINKNDSCSTTTKKLDDIFLNKDIFKTDKSEHINSDIQGVVGALEAFKLIKSGWGWHYILSENSETNSVFKEIDQKVLSSVLMTFDNSIKKVDTLVVKDQSKKSSNKTEGYSILFSNNDTVMIDLAGDITNNNRLSRGTYEAIRIAFLLSRIIEAYKQEVKTKRGTSSVFFIDEKMAYTHTELEKLLLTLIITKIGSYNQFFYTTHNCDVLDLDLPIHSFVFTKKEDSVTKFIQASSICKKNDRKLRNYVKNDRFETLPDLSLLEDILFED